MKGNGGEWRRMEESNEGSKNGANPSKNPEKCEEEKEGSGFKYDETNG